jgi:hypothetical protein
MKYSIGSKVIIIDKKDPFHGKTGVVVSNAGTGGKSHCVKIDVTGERVYFFDHVLKREKIK